ncbi:MAG: hypothetical protein E7314_04450 [Clostridiales bacterium]|nr:hypothetical protein [Clostridiales bacterium]
MDVSVQKRRDILNYLGTFLISQISFMKIFVPFVIGFIEKRETQIHKKLVLYGISIVTVILRFSFYEGIEYFINVLLISTVFEFLKQKDIENIKFNIIALFSITLVSSIIWQIFSEFVLYDLVTAVVVSIFAVVGFIFFDNFDFNFDEIDEKNFLMITALIGILLSTFGNVKIFNINIRNIIAIYLVLSFAYMKNIKYAVLSGLIIGTISEIVNADMGTFIISLTLGGFLASIFRTRGKIATIAGFILGNTILAYYLIGYDLLIARFLEITFAGVLLLLTEKRLQNVNTIFVEPPLMLATANTNIIDNFVETSNNLLNISTAIDNFGEEYSEEEDIFDILKNETCSNCKCFEKCWEDNYDATMDDIFNYIEKIEDDYYESFLDDKIFRYSYCKDERKIKNKILLEYGRYKQNKDTITTSELKRCVSTQIKGISKYISDITNKARSSNIKNIEQRIITDFEKNNLAIDRALINMKENTCQVELKGDKYELKNNIAKSNALLSEILNKRMVNINQNGNEFKQADKFRIETGIAVKSARGQKVSGDTYKLIDFLEDKYIMILSDGMGIGKEAKQMSGTLVDMYTDMAENNVSAEMITTIIGSFSQYISNSEKIITLDSTLINLITGECEIIKIGGAPTFIIKKDSVDIIYSDTLPMGIFEDVEYYKESVFLESGDIIVTVSDGVIDSKREIVNKEFWVSGFLKNLYIDEPQIIAEELLQKTIENYNGDILDDVTIIVQKVI